MTHRNAAAAFNATAQDILRARGEEPSMIAIARILGVPRQAWGRWVHGGNPTTGSVSGWLRQWTSAGYPALEVRNSGDGFIALTVEVDEPEPWKPAEHYTNISAAEWDIPEDWGTSVVHEGERCRYGEVEGIGWALCPEEES